VTYLALIGRSPALTFLGAAGDEKGQSACQQLRVFSRKLRSGRMAWALQNFRQVAS